MARVTFAASAALAGALALAVVGCSDTSLDASPATGDVVEGSAYRFTAPDGWSEVPAAERASGADTQIVDGAADGTFADTMVVVASPGGALTPDQVESIGVAELGTAGLRDITVGERVVVGGAESAHLTATRLTNAAAYTVDQYYLTHDGRTWVVNFSFDAAISADDRDEVAGSVLVTWGWL